MGKKKEEKSEEIDLGVRPGFFGFDYFRVLYVVCGMLFFVLITFYFIVDEEL
jgi:hypothetical protein